MEMFKSLAVVALLAAAGCCQSKSDDEINTREVEAASSEPSAGKDPVACQTESRETGICIVYHLCHDNATIIKDGYEHIDIRNGDRPCSHYMESCCIDPKNKTIYPPEETPKYSCGVRNIKGIGFRTTGDINNESKFGEFPYIVIVFGVVSEDDKKLNVYVGGGSLIHPSIVLTVAHGVNTTSEFRIRAGEWDTETSNEIYQHQERDVKKVVMHDKFDEVYLLYDIALLFLAEPLELAPHIGVACLPRLGESAAHNDRCQTCGWGTKSFEEKRYQNILKRVEIPVVNRDMCQEQLRKTRMGRDFVLHSSFMCAGGEPGKDACTGDGGSPLVCPLQNVRDRYVQYGIVAWGVGCGKADVPGVYMDLANLRPWIDEKVIAHGYNPQVYTY